MCKFYNQTRSYRLFKRYKRFKHDLEYKDKYFERIILIVGLALIIDLLLLYMVKWYE